VEVNLEVGLPEAIKLKVGDWQHYQKLDYEQLSFKCRGCHEYGHFQRNCPKDLNKDRETSEGWQQARRGRPSSKVKGTRPEKMTQAHPEEQGANVETGNSGMRTDLEKGKDATEKEPLPNPEVDPEPRYPTSEPTEIPMQERVREQGPKSKENNKDPEVEEGEVFSDSNTEEDSGTDITPKKPNRGRKTKKVEREKETYKDVLNGSQPTIKQLISVRQTRKKSRAPQGGLISPSGNQ
jgi:hypothetical protein